MISYRFRIDVRMVATATTGAQKISVDSGCSRWIPIIRYPLRRINHRTRTGFYVPYNFFNETIKLNPIKNIIFYLYFCEIIM